MHNRMFAVLAAIVCLATMAFAAQPATAAAAHASAITRSIAQDSLVTPVQGGFCVRCFARCGGYWGSPYCRRCKSYCRARWGGPYYRPHHHGRRCVYGPYGYACRY